MRIFQLSSEVSSRNHSYAAIPEHRYIDLFKLTSLDELRELASSLGCDPDSSFINVQEVTSARASILRAGVPFEDALRTFTVDQLNHAGENWAKALSRSGADVNSMDTMGILYYLAGNFIETSEPDDGLFAWIDHTA